MPLKSIINSLDAVDESHRSFYREEAGRHVLDVESVDGFALENVNGLKTATLRLSAGRPWRASTRSATSIPMPPVLP